MISNKMNEMWRLKFDNSSVGGFSLSKSKKFHFLQISQKIYKKNHKFPKKTLKQKKKKLPKSPLNHTSRSPSNYANHHETPIHKKKLRKPPYIMPKIHFFAQSHDREKFSSIDHFFVLFFFLSKWRCQNKINLN